MQTLDEIRKSYPQYSDMSDADLAGALHQKFYHDMPREEFDKKIGVGAAAAPVTANNVVRSAGTGIPVLGGILNRLDAGTNATLAPVLNPLFDPKDQLSEENWSERYAHSLRDQEGMDKKFADEHPIVDTGAKIAGGVAATLPMAATATGARLLGMTGETLPQLVRNGAVSGGIIGGADAAVRGENPLTGAAFGGGLGGGLPAVAAGLRLAATPVISNIRARMNPAGYAESQVARAVQESGQTPAQITRQVADADAAGQGVFTVADAMGNPGQRMLASTARAPGRARTDVVDFLEGRQAGQGERVGNIIDEGLGAGNTARQTVDELTQTARREAAPLYREALEQQPVWNNRMQEFFDDPITHRGLREGVGVQRLESLAAGERFNPTDFAITDFNGAGDPIISGVPNMRTINLIKKGWDNILEGYRDKTTGRLVLDEHGRALDQVRRAFLNEVDSLNPKYAQARAAYAGPAQVRDAVDAGARAASRGRSADNLQRFDALTAPSQQGFRGGYADTLAARIESTASGSNKVRPLSSIKATDELSALSLHQGPVQPGYLDPLSQRLGREQRMFQTRNAATGNSKTAENFADDAAMAVDPGMITNVITGNYGAALRSAIHAGHNRLTGNTPEVRAEVARILLQRGQTVPPRVLEQLINRAVQRIENVQRVARQVTGSIGRGTQPVLTQAESAGN